MKPELPELPKRDNSSEPKPESNSESKPSFSKPKLYVEPDPTPSQHIRILECNKEISRIFYECYHCKQGFLTECQGTPPLQDIDLKCSNCGKTSIKLLTNKVISTTAIPSPWG